MAKFEADAGRKLRKISAELKTGKFSFGEARGIPVPKMGSDGKRSLTKIRPLVLAPVEARIVQRSLLDVLCTVPAVRAYVDTPFSFGGIKKGESDLAAVPAAIRCVLDAIGGGAQFIVCADIQSFFTRIRKSSVITSISDLVHDAEFISLLQAAIEVNLANMADLREKAKAFPIEDIGVAQGNSLSPLLGNIVLHKFDREMNEGDCRCIRYIDDFIILAPTAQAARSRLRRAVRLLSGLGMKLSPEKTSREPVPVSHAFEFLGIELANGFIRPAQKARAKFLASVRAEFDASCRGFADTRTGRPLAKSLSLISTLKRVDGMVQGWGKHYRFCNDAALFRRLDDDLSALVRGYLGAYRTARERSPVEQQPHLLGMEQLAAQDREPLAWPAGRARSRGSSHPHPGLIHRRLTTERKAV